MIEGGPGIHSIGGGAVSAGHPHPLLFVHGAWHGSWCWEENFLPYFIGEGYSCTAFDFRGHGQSGGRDALNSYSLESYVEDFALQAQKLAKPPVVIAHSMGGLVAQLFAREHEVAGLVLLAPVPLGGVGYGYGSAHPVPFLKFLLTRDGYAMIKGERLAKSLFFSADMPEETFRRYYGKLQSESFRALLEIGRGVEMKPLKGMPPVLILEAERDAVIPAKKLEETAKFYGVQTTKVPSIAHDLMLDVGWRKAADEVALWLKKTGI